MIIYYVEVGHRKRGINESLNSPLESVKSDISYQALRLLHRVKGMLTQQAQAYFRALELNSE
jgi:hypothetical protein